MSQWFTVTQTAQHLGESEETIVGMIERYELPATRASLVPWAEWLVPARELERQLVAGDVRADVRRRLAGAVLGYGDFTAGLAGSPHRQQVLDVIGRNELLAGIGDEETRRLFAELDADGDASQ